MGLDAPAVKWLFGAKSRGADFSELATLGRQGFFPERDALQLVFDRLSLELDAKAFLQASGGYGERFFELLGARTVTSFDKSDYQIATRSHDMNTPIDASLKNRFSVVLDAGTIEHVFNFPQAIKNCMEMVGVGGHFIQITVANNFIGHGFYQFSPELMYRVFSQENGFAIEALLLNEVVPNGKWYRMHDPAKLGHRVELTTRNPTYLLMLAKKAADVPIFATAPQQSDYVAMWHVSETGVAPPAIGRPGPRFPAIRRMVPPRAKRVIRRLCGPGANSAVDRIDDRSVLLGRF